MEIIRKYFPELSPEQLERYRQLEGLVLSWNQRINLISRKETGFISERHILHSLGIAKFASFLPGESVIDVGTGGGFPGLPLAIFFPATEFLLIDSIGKKINAVREMASELDLQNVKCRQVRAEDLDLKADHIVSRAVTNLDRFVSWIHGKLKKHSNNPDHAKGLWYLKGGDLSGELGSFPDALIYELNQEFKEEFFDTKKLVFLDANSLV